MASNKSLWYAFGPQGETRQLTDANGAVVDTYIYTAYGVPGPTTGSDPNPFRYGGQVGYYTDASVPSGLILCGARWYNPALARWISRDPIGYEGGDNLYGYCDQDPISLVDPEGTVVQHLLGAVTNVGTGWLLAQLTGQQYTWKDAAQDAVTGAVGVGLFNKLGKLSQACKGIGVSSRRGQQALNAVKLGAAPARKAALQGKNLPIQSVARAFKSIGQGTSNVRVTSRNEAWEVFKKYAQSSGEELFNTTGKTGNAVRNCLPNGKAGTFHWDYEDTIHRGLDEAIYHLQIHTAEGRIIRIFFEKGAGIPIRPW